jgi:hypothetical protein
LAKRDDMKKSGKRATADRGAAVGDSKPVAIQSEETKGSIEELVLQKSSGGGIELTKLANELERDLGYSRDRILRRIMQMKDSGKIRIVESSPYSSLAAYFFSPMNLWFWAAAFATIVSLLLISFTSGFALYLRYVFGGLLVLFLPGYSLVQLLYAKKEELDDLVRLAFSIGLSLAIVPITGLLLNYTPYGIRLLPIAISLASLTLIFLLGAVRRKYSYYRLLRDIS